MLDYEFIACWWLSTCVGYYCIGVCRYGDTPLGAVAGDACGSGVRWVRDGGFFNAIQKPRRGVSATDWLCPGWLPGWKRHSGEFPLLGMKTHTLGMALAAGG